MVMVFCRHPAFLHIISVFRWLALSRLFFFFKQKTAYEMRISDWSSDVCSSDLEFCLCGQARLPRWPIRSPQRRAMATGRTSITGPALAMRRCKRTLFAVVGDAVRLVDLADDVPVRLEVDRDELDRKSDG